MRLNKFLSKAGVASRREADRLIQSAIITVNDVVQMNPAYQVSKDDIVISDGQRVVLYDDIWIIALNKPKGFITTVSDPEKRRTVMELVPSKPRLFPIGRLDYNTSGLLLMTNDGDLAQQMMQPKNKVPRIYNLEIDRPLNKNEIKKMSNGIYISKGQRGHGIVHRQKIIKKRTLIRLELQQGKNREIRRMMAILNRKIFSLQRIKFGSISIQGIPEGHWRKLSSNEIKKLREINQKNTNQCCPKQTIFFILLI